MSQENGKLAQRRAVVIGSGPSGLAAALALTARGAKVHLIEENDNLSREMMPEEMEGFRFEPWPVLISDPSPLVDLFALNGHRISDFLTLRRADPLCQVWLDPETRIDWPADPEAFIARMEKLEGRPGRLRDYLAWGGRLASARRGILHAARTKGTLTALWHGRRWLPGWRLWRLTDASRLRAMAGNNAAIWRSIGMLSLLSGIPAAASHGDLPRVAHEFAHDGGWIMEGGMAGLTRALLRLAEIKGIRIHKGHRVTRIVLNGGRVRRVEAVGMRPLSASILVATNAPADVLEACYPPPEAPAKKPAKKRPVARELSLIRWDIVSSRCPLDLAEATFFPAPNPREEDRFLHHWKVPSPAPSLLVVRAQGERRKTKEGGKREFELAGFSIFARVPESSARFRWTDQSAEDYQRQIVRTLESAGFDGWDQELVASRMIHPASPEQPGRPPVALRNWRDLLRLENSRVPGASGLYLAGPHRGPGGGLSGELTSGIMAAEIAESDAAGSR